ncbi:hypothetical protein HDK90DRAFT_186863 [Phyllosticta capitalensis]|uniref:Secreted protein n=1 Tax=Phyllosticta capitalensis TaxID=121624 RepID=A0ABR1YX27_9PEZI
MLCFFFFSFRFLFLYEVFVPSQRRLFVVVRLCQLLGSTRLVSRLAIRSPSATGARVGCECWGQISGSSPTLACFTGSRPIDASILRVSLLAGTTPVNGSAISVVIQCSRESESSIVPFASQPAARIESIALLQTRPWPSRGRQDNPLATTDVSRRTRKQKSKAEQTSTVPLVLQPSGSELRSRPPCTNPSSLAAHTHDGCAYGRPPTHPRHTAERFLLLCPAL